MKRVGVVLLALSLLAAFALGGCCSTTSETEKVVVPAGAPSTTTTLGQELQDLENAYKKGTITDQEYEAAKKRLIEQRTGK